MKKRENVVLITGASSGMGRATALFLAQKGFKVYAGSRKPKNIPKEKNLTTPPPKEGGFFRTPN
jgi:NADP-dependent 3-hydroxy acid dehydrogenase YdfG